MPILEATLLGASAASSFLESRKSGKEARKSRKAGEKLGAETLAFAKEVFQQFQPIIRDTTDFFATTSLDDIVSGKVLAPGAAGAVNRFNLAARDTERRIEENLARRGISNDPAGVSELSEFDLERDRIRTSIAGDAVERDIDRRIGLTNLGTAQAGRQIDAANRISSQLLGRSSQLNQQAGSQAADAGFSLAESINEFRKRKTPTTV